jgi:carbamoyltransferase
MNVLGISGGVRIGNQDGAAALMVDGRLMAAAEEERFTGIKFANGMLPRHALRYCLRAAALSIHDIDCVVFVGATYVGIVDVLRRWLEFQFGYAPKVQLVDHHTAHAASTFLASGWDEALIVTFDFSGDGISTSVRTGKGTQFETLAEVAKPNSLGVFYSAVTQFLGFQKDSDEYKVMGMAAYGTPHFELDHVLASTPGGYEFRHAFLRGVKAGEPAPSKQEPLFDEFPLPIAPRVPGSPIEQVHYDIAASAQRQLEQVATRLVEHYARARGLDRVCLAGGVALNCKMNEQIRRSPAVRELYVPPVASDAGLALGAAYLGAVEAGDRVEPLRHAYWGPEFTPAEIREMLDRAAVPYEETDDPVDAAAERLLSGKIVAWFQGRMEYGPRALGNRSILADARNETMKDEINARVKFREEFRPVAPAVLDDAGPMLFDGYRHSPFMTQTFPTRPLVARIAPAIVHADGTCRLQSVRPDANPMFHQLLNRFHHVSGVPLVINTSLNAYNDPMACEPFQALRTYFVTGLDSLVMGPFLLDKRR